MSIEKMSNEEIDRLIKWGENIRDYGKDYKEQESSQHWEFSIKEALSNIDLNKVNKL